MMYGGYGTSRYFSGQWPAPGLENETPAETNERWDKHMRVHDPVYREKAEMDEEYLRFKDHTRLPKHPAVTGRKDQCWACGLDADPAKCVFVEEVEERLPQLDDAGNPIVEPTKTCIFCSIECWRDGWPLVRHHYIISNRRSEADAPATAPATAANPTA
jgi:hypothetical protein